MELCLRSWNISNWRYQCLILGVSNKICFCIYTFKMWWCLGRGGSLNYVNNFIWWCLGGDHSPAWTIFLWFQDHLRHWIETSVQSTKLSHKHFSDKIPLWSFCAYVRFYRIIIFCYKTTFWFLRFETFWDLQNFLSLSHVKTSWLVMSYLGLAQFFSIYISFCF